jgi:hypothetical protein
MPMRVISAINPDLSALFQGAVAWNPRNKRGNKMKPFRNDNTDGYDVGSIDALNDEWAARVSALDLEEYTDEYNEALSQFNDEVARR